MVRGALVLGGGLFSYSAPAVDSLDPSTGAMWGGGGSYVTISGRGFGVGASWSAQVITQRLGCEPDNTRQGLVKQRSWIEATDRTTLV